MIKNIYWTYWELEDLYAEPNGIDIWEFDGECYFTLESAIRESKRQWLILPTSEDWISLVWYCGWFYETISELNLSTNWYIEIDENGCIVVSNKRFWYYWSVDWYRALFAKAFEHGNIINFKKFRNSWFSVRCIKL